MSQSEDNMPAKATLRSFVIGAFLSGFFAWVTVIRDNFEPVILYASYLLPALPFVALLIIGLLINPLLKYIKIIKLFNTSEKLLIFVMCAVASGTASFGLAGSILPLVSSLSNPKVNTLQSRIDINGMPFLNEDYFIIAEGSQEKAKVIRKVDKEFSKLKKIYQLSRDIKNSKADFVKVEKELKEAENIVSEKIRTIKIKNLKWSLRKTERILAETEESWNELASGLKLEDVIATYPEKIKVEKKKRDDLRAALREHNKIYFDSITQARKGFSEEKRAIPGVIYTPGEGLLSYTSRYERFSKGTTSLSFLRELEKDLKTAIITKGKLSSQSIEKLEQAINILDTIKEVEGLKEKNEKASKELKDFEQKLEEKKSKLSVLNKKEHFAPIKDVVGIKEEIEKLEDPVEEMEEEVKALRERFDLRINQISKMCELISLTQEQLTSLKYKLKKAESSEYLSLRYELKSAMANYIKFDASSRRYFIGEAKWSIWITPLSNWLILIFLGYLVFMTFNTLVYRQWAYHEKLIYPLAEITTLLASDKNDLSENEPVLFKSGLFWTGFVIAAGVLGWNYLARNDIISNINPIELQAWFTHYVGGSELLGGLNSQYFVVIFAVIGLSFLVPANVSFSLWFFEILCMCLWLAMAWLGYGSGRWSVGNQPRFNIGGGAMLVFGLTILWTCRHYLLCYFIPSVLKDLENDEKKELRVCSALFLFGIIALVTLLVLRLDVNLFYACLYILLALILTIAMVRSVAEGGILGLECGFGSFAFVTTVLGTAKAWCAASLFAPVLIFNNLLIGNLKGFIAPTMANSLKIREKIRINRLAFHGSIWVGIVIAVFVSLVSLIILYYDVGANSFQGGWMHKKHNPPGISGMIANPQGPNVIHTNWVIAGAVLMTIILIARRSFFWVPHPLGLVVFINPSMYGFWSSILIGWIFKVLVSKYCRKEQYLQIRCFFVGLVVGHLFAAICNWDVLDWHWG